MVDEWDHNNTTARWLHVSATMSCFLLRLLLLPPSRVVLTGKFNGTGTQISVPPPPPVPWEGEAFEKPHDAVMRRRLVI